MKHEETLAFELLRLTNEKTISREIIGELGDEVKCYLRRIAPHYNVIPKVDVTFQITVESVEEEVEEDKE